KDHAATDVGKKAAGAIKRLDLVDKVLDLSGPGADGKKVDVKDYRGKTLLVVFWSSEAPQSKAELERLQKGYAKYHDKGLEVVGVNLDNAREAMDATVREGSLGWPQIHEPGGMDGRLADEFCILTLPTMFLVDPQGKVVSRSLRTAAELERLLEKPVA